MIHLTADDTTLLKDLALFVEPVEISDASGKLVGLFVPANLERGRQLYAGLAARTDQTEMERREREEKTGRTTQEVLARLAAQAQPGTPPLSDTGNLAEKDECATP